MLYIRVLFEGGEKRDYIAEEVVDVRRAVAEYIIFGGTFPKEGWQISEEDFRKTHDPKNNGRFEEIYWRVSTGISCLYSLEVPFGDDK